jgi:hypothetical protein
MNKITDGFHFDQQFNFDNKIVSKPRSRHELEDFRCGGIMLEPRLQEYLKKKKMYHEQNILPVISIEQEFSITPEDKKKMAQFFSGKNNLYDKNTIETKNTKTEKMVFPSSSFKKDPRVKEIKKPSMDKIPDMTPNNIQVSRLQYPLHGRDIISGECDNGGISSLLDFNNFDNLECSGLESVNLIDKPQIAEYKTKTRDNKRKVTDQPLYPQNNKWDNNYNQSSIINYDDKQIRPSVSTNRQKDINTIGYQPIPFQGAGTGNSNEFHNVSLMCDIPTRTKKTYGYDNVSEHHYHYISDGVQDPNKFTTPRGGVSTRLDNKKRAVKREIL